MNYDYTIKITLEENEKEAIKVLAQTYGQCTMDGRLECKECPFNVCDGCLPHAAYVFKATKGDKV